MNHWDPMAHLDVKQGSDAWRAIRLGKVTASRMADMLATTRSGWGAGRQNYKTQLVWERLLRVSREGFKSADMEAGTEAEPEARAAYECLYLVDVEECGFIPHPTIGMSGASPDGLVGTDGLVEIKCPILATHQETLLGGSIKRQYELQRQWQLACTGRKWCDFVSYLDRKRHPEDGFDIRGTRLIVRRTWRNEAQIAEIEKEVIVFLREVDTLFAELDQRYPDPTAAAEIAVQSVLEGG